MYNLTPHGSPGAAIITLMFNVILWTKYQALRI